MTPTRAFPAVGMPALPFGGDYNAFSYKLFENFSWTFLKGSINKWRQEKLGLPPYPHSGPFAPLRDPRTPTLYGFSPTVLPKPPDWGANVHVTGYWFLPETDWQPPQPLADFLRAGPPPVYVGFGSLIDAKPEALVALVLAAVKQAGVRAVLAAGWGGLTASQVPAEVFLIDSAPHDWLFPRMAAVVHHGGAGTTGTGLRAGVPNVVVPFRGDQPFWARRVAALGAGPQPIPRGQLTAERLADALKLAVTDPALKARSAALGQAIQAEDGVGNAVRIIAEALPKLAR
jgi:UDP:flavonoid glycosyltransferase YjiC (YdhE family)